MAAISRRAGRDSEVDARQLLAEVSGKVPIVIDPSSAHW